MVDLERNSVPNSMEIFSNVEKFNSTELVGTETQLTRFQEVWKFGPLISIFKIETEIKKKVTVLRLSTFLKM